MFSYKYLILLSVVVLVFLFGSGIVTPLGLFDLVLLQPILNLLFLLSKYLFDSMGLAIVALTIIIRLITLPLTMRQMHSMKAMQMIQPKLKELQKKYSKDRQQLGQEMQKLYREHGVNPLGCATPMLLQLPIWIGLYQSVIQGLAYAPENLVGLSKQLYPWALIQEQVPLNSQFLWLDLGSGDIFMAIMVAASMWALQKMSTQPTVDASQQSMTRMMVWMMPLMFGFFAMSFPSGLSLYWILTNLISIVIQYRVTGWGTLSMPAMFSPGGRRPQPVNIPASTTETSEDGEEESDSDSDVADSGRAAAGDEQSHRKRVRHEKHRDKRKVRRRSR